MPLNATQIRSHFPSLALKDNGRERIYFDGPAGTQVAQQVIDQTSEFFLHHNTNGGGHFHVSKACDKVNQESHLAAADFLNAPRTEEIIFGPNMTTLTYQISRSLGKWMQKGDKILLSKMDHDANVYPWMQLAEDLDLEVVWLSFDRQHFQYDLEEYQQLLSKGIRLAAFTMASNALGTINPVRKMCQMAKEAGTLTFIDAVQFAPHGPIDVQEIDCDFLTCSVYKIFGGHQGILWGREALLSSLPAYQVRPAADKLPKRFETGTQAYESQAGTLGAFTYLEWVGKHLAAEYWDQYSHFKGRRQKLHAAMAAIKSHEEKMGARLINGMLSIEGIQIYGITDSSQFTNRVPTVAFTKAGKSPETIATYLADHNIFVWNGHYYALEVVEHLGLSNSGGMVRVGLVHYNTEEEVDRFLEVLSQC